MDLGDLSVPSGERQAALMLHSLGKQDRDWLLSTVSPHQRRALQSLLADLRSLGLPTQERVAFGAPSAQVAGNGIPESDADFLLRLGALHIPDIAALLESESAFVAAHIGSLLSVPHRNQLIDALEPGMRRDIALQLQGGPVSIPYALRSSLMAALRRRYPVRQDDVLAARTGPRIASVRRRVSTFLKRMRSIQARGMK